MPVNDELGKRLKHNYEEVYKTRLTRRMPVAIRCDGRSFHTFVRGMKKPFDRILMDSMQDTMMYLCEHIQGCVFGYTQSDEITLILTDYDKLTTDAWFDYEVQKVCSISASMATMVFNKAFSQAVRNYSLMDYIDIDDNYYDALSTAVTKGAMFDSRCFNIPKEEVANLVWWRVIDAVRNSIQMVGQANFSHAELQNKGQNDIKQMLLEQKNICWEDFDNDCKNGLCYAKLASGWTRIDTPFTRVELGALIDPLVFKGEQ